MIPGYPNNRVRLSINCVAVNDNTLLNQGNLPLPSIFPHGATIMICFIHVTFLHTLFFLSTAGSRLLPPGRFFYSVNVKKKRGMVVIFAKVYQPTSNRKQQ